MGGIEAEKKSEERGKDYGLPGYSMTKTDYDGSTFARLFHDRN